MVKTVSAADLAKLVAQGDAEVLPGALEQLLAGLRDDIKADAEARRREAKALQEMFLSAVERIASSRQEIDLDQLLTRMATIMGQSMRRPEYEFTIHRDGMGMLEKVSATPKVLN